MMRGVRFSMFGALAGIGVIAASPATAAVPVPYIFNLFATSNSNLTGTVGNPIDFSVTGSLGKITATATAWNATYEAASKKFVVHKAYIGDYVGGLGVTSSFDDLPVSGCGEGDCYTHQIDNFGNVANSKSYDFVQLHFTQAVTISELTRYAYGSYSASLDGGTIDDDFSYGVGTAMTEGRSVNALTDLFSKNGTNSPGGACNYIASAKACIDTTALATLGPSQNWYIAASVFDNYGGDGQVDSFKLYSATVLASAPEPVSWATMVIGFGVIGGAMRARRRTGAVVA